MFALLEFPILSPLVLGLLTLLTKLSSANQQIQLTQFKQLLSADGSAACAVDSAPYKSYTVDGISRCTYDCVALRRQTSNMVACAGFNYYEQNNTCQPFTVGQRLYFAVNPPCTFFSNGAAADAIDAQAVCPSSFTYISEVKGCYKGVRTNLDWDSAALYCQGLVTGGHLVAINSSQENAAVSTLTANNIGCLADPWSGISWWIGLHWFNSTSGISSFCWKFNSTSTLGKLTYVNWNSPQQPDNLLGNEYCGSMMPDYQWKWQDIICNVPVCFICEVDL